MGGQGGCDRRIERFIGKFTKQKIQGGGVGLGGGGGVRMDVNQELKFFWKIQKTIGGGGGGGWVHGGSGLGGQDGCERRIEVFVKIKKKNVFFFFGGGGGRGGGGRVGGSGWM